MNIKDQEFVTSSGARCGLRATAIDLLRHLPHTGGVDVSRRNLALATKMESFSTEFSLSPEEASVIRDLLNRAPHLPPTVQVGMFDAFNPED